MTFHGDPNVKSLKIHLKDVDKLVRLKTKIRLIFVCKKLTSDSSSPGILNQEGFFLWEFFSFGIC
jgi:hypothetical protein